jgi:two-component system chemotaxis response regulator CheB
MSMIDVLVVDDSVVVRRLLTTVLGGDPEIAVVGTAATGRIALAKIPQVAPDLVVLDLEMPDLDGLGTLREIRRLYPTLPVVMFGSLTEGAARPSLEALTLGPTDFVAKPANVQTLYRGVEQVCDELVAMIKALCPVRRPLTFAQPATTGTMSPAPRRVTPARSVAAEVPAEVLAIGASTGGPEALAGLLPQLPADFPVPVLVVQHMPPLFTARFAERLDASCRLKVREARVGDVVTAGTVLLAPGDFHMRLRRDGEDVRVTLDQAVPESFCRPAVDPLLRSVGDVYGAASLILILTGMGQDGLRGCQRLSALGGRVLAQDQQSSVVWGMPGAVATAGVADRVLPLGDMVPEILRSVLVGRPQAVVPVGAP